MASLIDNGTFTFNPEEVKSYSEVIQQLVYNNPTITDIQAIETGIKHDKQIVFAGKLGLLGKSKTDCTPNPAGGITLTQKFWRPKLFDFRLEHCQADVNAQDKLVNQWTRVNPDFHNIVEGSGSATGDFLVGIVQDAMPEDILVKAWFSDTASAVFPTGNFSIGTDLALVNTINGIFKQIFTEIPTPTVAIGKNAGVNYANQELESGESIVVFKGLYNKSDSRLRNSPDAQFLVTRSLYDGLYNDLEDKNLNTAGLIETTLNGLPVLTYRGIKIVMVEFWDRYIASMQNNGTKYFRPHRAILTTKNNIPIGTPDTQSLTSLDAFYDKVTKKNYIDAEYGLDAKLLETYLCAVAY